MLMTAALKRIPEPEKMTDEEENFYALADYSKPHDIFVQHVIHTVGEHAAIKAADLGCGPGDILLRLRKRVDWDLWGIDKSTGMLQIAAVQAEKQLTLDQAPINWLIADIKKTALPTHFFDVILCNSVLHHLSDPILFWREIKRLAKPNAFIFIRDLRRPTNANEADRLVAQHVGNESAVVQTHYRSSLQSAYTVAEIHQQFKDTSLHGLVVREWEDRYLDIYGQILGEE